MAQKKSQNRKAQPVKPATEGRRRNLLWGGVAAVMVAGALLYFLYGYPHPKPLPGTEERDDVPVDTQFVGNKACVSCHEKEASEWQKSQHHDAMAQASDQSALGNFNNTKFSYAGITSTFFKRDGKFFVNTDGPDGKLADFEIKYTFGVAPLQQYLIEMPGLRFQALSIAWDSRPKEQGGQRWFHLYPNEKITHDDELHWTRPTQNWNFMCADCHSTALRKNHDPAGNRFKTQWAEINVGCEACHGPGSAHVTWAKAQIPLNPPIIKGEKTDRNNKGTGLTVRLDERRGVVWNRSGSNVDAVRSRPRVTEREIAVCAQCHARRGQIADGYQAGKPFLDYYRPALLNNPLYHTDGQQRDEVYIWGSFLQSKMYANGVTCSDCHNPHSGKLRAEGNSLCAQCHLESKYDTVAHYHHKAGSAGAACVACHMAATTYMVVDPRRDHSLRVPRPDLSVKFATPNACNGCHKDHDAGWAAAQVKQWYGRDPEGYQRFASAFAAANAGVPDARAQLRATAADASYPAIARATALVQLTAPLGQAALDTIAAGLRDRSPLVRLGALQSLANASPDTRAQLALPLLSDPLRAIRIEAASELAAVAAEQLDAEQRGAFERASAEYVASQQYNADRADTRVNLGAFYANRGDPKKAEEEFKAAIAVDPFFIPAYVNLADLYRARGRDPEGERILREGLKVAPKSAMLHHALGLALVRLKQTDAALAELERATILDPTNGRFSYVYAVALHSTGQVEAAIGRLEKSLATHPNDRDILTALVSFLQARGDSTAAKKYADRLQALADR